MAYLETIRQQPHDRRDYDISFEEWWPDGDTIDTVSLTCYPVGMTMGYAISGQSVKVWLSGGTDQTNYKVTVLATSVLNRSKEVELKVRIKDE